MKSVNKKGSNVEVIISFVIFVTALAALYAIVKPAISEPISKEYLVDSIKTDIESATSGVLSIDYINVKKDTAGDCFVLNSYSPENTRLVVKYENGMEKDAYTKEGLLSIKANSSGIYKIFYKDTFQGITTTTCSNQLTKDVDYTFENRQVAKYILLSKMKNLQGNYNSDYSNLKQKYGIPDGTEFEFTFTNLNKSVIAQGIRPYAERKNKNIYAEEIPIIYAHDSIKDINITTGFLTVRIW
jgi:hypothetical protein